VAAPGRSISSPIGQGGEFELENVPAGRHSAVVTFKGLACQVVLDVPASQEPIVRLGILRCLVPEPTDDRR
jgi:hypothetical protein